jgi:hypothetical protein
MAHSPGKYLKSLLWMHVYVHYRKYVLHILFYDVHKLLYLHNTNTYYLMYNGVVILSDKKESGRNCGVISQVKKGKIAQSCCTAKITLDDHLYFYGTYKNIFIFIFFSFELTTIRVHHLLTILTTMDFVYKNTWPGFYNLFKFVLLYSFIILKNFFIGGGPQPYISPWAPKCLNLG